MTTAFGDSLSQVQRASHIIGLGNEHGPVIQNLREQIVFLEQAKQLVSSFLTNRDHCVLYILTKSCSNSYKKN